MYILWHGVDVSNLSSKSSFYSFRKNFAERAIDEIDRMVACCLADANLPRASWDVVGKHCTLINAVTQSYPTDSSITIYEAETSRSGMILALPFTMLYLLSGVSAYVSSVS